jgi:hypothetical protein
MITDADAEFHSHESADWAETNYFGFYVPDEKLNVGVYALFRPQLGVVLSTVCINSRFSYEPWHADYADMQAHVAIPAEARLTDYSLDNGLRVRSDRPNMHWLIDYTGRSSGCEIHVDYEALMAPFDIHDPDQDPMSRRAASVHGDDYAWGTAYNGHFDQTGRFRGELSLRGRRYEVDCVSTMDHSWGPRPEATSPTMSWFHAHFGSDFSIHTIFSFDAAGGGSELELAHGYVLRDGEVHGVEQAQATTVRRGFYPAGITVELRDTSGSTYSYEGSALTSYPWLSWPNVCGHNALMHWRCEGREGYGEVMDFVGFEQLDSLIPSHPALVEAA